MNDMKPVLEKMREHLIAKNVASDIAAKLCDSVAAKLEGKVLGARSNQSQIIQCPFTIDISRNF